MELRETIDSMRAKNEEAHAVIHGALSHPENSKGRLVFPGHLSTSVFVLFFLYGVCHLILLCYALSF